MRSPLIFLFIFSAAHTYSVYTHNIDTLGFSLKVDILPAHRRCHIFKNVLSTIGPLQVGASPLKEEFLEVSENWKQ